jgi:CheY-like chemotaxis protein
MKNILIIDDDDLFRGMTKKLLEKSGYTVAEASDGQSGLKVAAEMSPDLIVTDIIMPNMDGLETITALRKNEPTMKIIAVSGGGRIASTCYLPTAKVMGAHKSFDKPFDHNEFLEAIKELLSSA